MGSGRGYLQDLVEDDTGLDLSPSVARRYHKKFVAGSATALPFPDNTFDAIWTVWGLEHIPEPEKTMREMRRVLKPGGLLVLVDPRRDHLFGWGAIDLVENAIFGLEEVRIFSVVQWYQLLGEAGFSDYRVDRGRFFSPVEWAEAFIEARA